MKPPNYFWWAQGLVREMGAGALDVTAGPLRESVKKLLAAEQQSRLAQRRARRLENKLKNWLGDKWPGP